jgi:hydrogenase nickel incorporation protein HypB
MCTTCGCEQGETRLEGEELHGHSHVHADGTVHSHPHVHGEAHGHEHPAPASVHEHAHGHVDGTVHSHPHWHDGEHVHDHGPGAGAHSVHYGRGAAGAHAPGLSQARMVKIEQDILAKNNEYAHRNRAWFLDHGVFALNFVSSPGSGKTTLLVRTIDALKGAVPVAVIEGDQETSHDAERIRATGAAAIQINTGKGCHLDAHMVGHAVERLKLPENSALMIENVGNLVCPSSFDLGEAHKVVVLSVTEGEDKPLKYPDMFHAADVMLLNKVDLLPYLSFNVPLTIEYARRVNPHIRVILTSAVTGEGLGDWFDWVAAGAAAARIAREETVSTLRRRVAELEAQLALRRD